MSSPRFQELMNKNSQHEFRFTSQDGLQIECTSWNGRGPARGDWLSCDARVVEAFNELNRSQVRTNILVWLSSVLHDQSRNREALCPR
jgi:hypothetical protein